MRKFIFLLTFSPLFIYSQQNKDVLFIGNSYIFYNDLPNMVSQIALSFGDTLNYNASTPGGATFNVHANSPQTYTMMNQSQWDYVVLQAQSQEPSFSPGQVSSQTYPYAEVLVDSIEQIFNCSEPLFFMTWGRKYGDQQNCQFYPPICTYTGMQQRLRESYLEMSFDNNASCAPVGMAWKKSIEIDSTLNLYNSDNSHPNVYGSYLAACTFYSSIFKKSSVGSSYWPTTVDSSIAYSLQQIASTTVLDSLTVWNIFNADFDYSQNINNVNFTNLSSNYESVLWDFGDGNTSFDENPQYTYTSSGTYTVELYAFTNGGCLVDTITTDIVVNISTSVESPNQEGRLLKIVDVLGRNSNIKKNSILYYFFNNGKVEKKVVVE